VRETADTKIAYENHPLTTRLLSWARPNQVWDLNNFRCVQTFGSIDQEADMVGFAEKEPVTHLDALQVGIDQTRLVVGGAKRLMFYDQEKKEEAIVTDDLPISCACYNSDLLTIVTAAGTTIKVWDAILGNIAGNYPHAAKYEITAMTMDDRMRKIIVGDAKGNIDVLTHHSGSLIKSFDKYTDSSVVRMVYMGSKKSVLVAFANCSVLIFDEVNIEHCPLLRIFDEAHQNLGTLTGMCYTPCRLGSRGPFVATGSGKVADPIRLWNVSSARCDGVLAVPSDQDFYVLNMVFLDQAPLLAVSCSDGYIRIWAIWSVYGCERSCLIAFPNMDPIGYDQYTFAGEEDEQYPLFHPITRKDDSDDEEDHRNNGASAPSFAAAFAMSAAGTTRNLPKIKVVPDLLHLKNRKWVTRPGFDSPRRVMPTPAMAIIWEVQEQALYTGDESGRIRKWSLRPLFAKLHAEHILVREESGWKPSVIAEKKGGTKAFRVSDIAATYSFRSALRS